MRILAFTACFFLALAAAAQGAPQSSCANGVARDDGDPESGYGFVPSATAGIYVQKFNAADFPRRELGTVCVCWLKTRGDHEADFDVVFYEDRGGRPAPQPWATVPGHATEIPTSKETAGRFYAVDVSGVTLPPGESYIGVRWDPSVAQYLFICNDQSPASPFVDVFFQEDRAPTWRHVTETRDPIFKPHRSILVRAEALAPGVELPDAELITPRRGASATPRLKKP